MFALLIVPGYSYLAGYRVGRSHSLPARDLYVVAQAVVTSVVFVALGWLWIEDLLRWLADDTIGDHSNEALALLLGLIAIPFGVGRAVVALVERLGRWRLGERLLRALGALQETAWQEAWKAPLDSGSVVRIELRSGATVEGVLEPPAGSVDFPPLAPAVYLPTAFVEGPDGGWVTMDQGAFIPGEEIETLYLATPPDGDRQR